MDQEGVERAIRLIGEALETFGDHALLHAANGIFHWAAYDFGGSPTKDTLSKGEASATRALELNSDLSQAWLAKGLIRYKHGDMAGNVRCLRRALELERNGDTLFFLAFALADIGRMDEARRYSDESIERDPLTWITPFGRCVVDLFDGRFDAALHGFRRWMDKEMGIPAFSMWWLGQALAFAGEVDEAVAAFEQGARSEPGQFTEMCELGARAFRGEGPGALGWFESAKNLRDAAVHDEVYPAFVSTCFARLGEVDLALRWLEQAIRWGFTNHRFHSEHNPFLTPLRGNPRFEALMQLAQEKTQVIELG
jgi:tetratricopeptide (TPR) repeat protein